MRQQGSLIDTDSLNRIGDWIITGAIRIFIVAIAGGLLWLLLTWAWRRYWYCTPVARKAAARRERIEREFGLKVGRIGRYGWMRIAPGESEKWARPGLKDELAVLLSEPRFQLKMEDGYVRFDSAPELPTGEDMRRPMVYDKQKGIVTCGYNVETGDLDGFNLRESSLMLVAAKPGAGKTVFVDGVVRCLQSSDSVEVLEQFDGKRQDPEDIVPGLLRVQEIMEKRLSGDVDFWAKPGKILVVVLDECQRVFAPQGTDKKSKQDAEYRTKLVADLVERGRSSGVLVIAATQRMTAANGIPSQIRNLAGVRVCGRCRVEDAELVLGYRPGEEDPQVHQFRQPGRFAIEDDAQDIREIQVFG